MFNSSLFTPALLRTHSFVFFAVHVTRNILLSPFISKASRLVSSFFLRFQLSQPYVVIFAVKRSLRIPRETRETTLGSRTAKEQNRTEPAGLCVGLRQETDGLAESWGWRFGWCAVEPRATASVNVVCLRWRQPVQSLIHSCLSFRQYVSTSAVFTCIGALGTPSRTGPLARKYLPGFPYSWSLRRLRQNTSSIYCTAICNYPSAAQEQPMYNSMKVDQICTASVCTIIQ